jgi:hypothetical protein
LRRIEKRIERFISDRKRPFTINDVFNEVSWNGSKKNLARYIKLNPRIKNLGHRRVAGRKLVVYQRSESGGLFGGE